MRPPLPSSFHFFGSPLKSINRQPSASQDMELTPVSTWSSAKKYSKFQHTTLPSPMASVASPSPCARHRRTRSVITPRKIVSATDFTESRFKFWLMWSGALDKKSAAPTSYMELVAAVADVGGKKGEESETKDPNWKQIELDLRRSGSDSEPFDKPENIDALRRVLRAWCALRPDPGYLQSMNFLAAFLLVQIGVEEDAFWVLDALLTDVFPAFYSPGLPGLTTLISKFEALIEHKLPRVHAHQNLLGLSVTFRAYAWFLSLFFSCLKDTHLLRTWDLVFYHYHHNKNHDINISSTPSKPSTIVPHPPLPIPTLPSPPCNATHAEAVLLCVGLALLKTVEEKLCKCSNSTDLGIIVQELGISLTMPEDEFFDVAFGGGICSLWEAAADRVEKRRAVAAPEGSKTPQPKKKIAALRTAPQTVSKLSSRTKRPDKENSRPDSEAASGASSTSTETPKRRSIFSVFPASRKKALSK